MAAKARQPLSPETVSISSRNGLRDGLFARVHYLDDEDPAEIAALRQRYLDDKQPRDATEEFLVNECFYEDVMGQRYHRAVSNELRRQQRLNRQRWEEERTATAGALRDQLVAPETVDLDPIVVELKGFGHGLEYLYGAWLRLKTALTTRGFLCPEEANMGLRLMGVLPSLESVAQHQDGFLFMLWSTGCHPAAPLGMIETLLQPAHRPAGLEDTGREELLPDPAECRDQLIKWVDDELAALAALADQVARAVDGPELARVLNPAAIVMDPEKAKRFERARSNYQSTYYRAKNALEAGRKGETPVNKKPPRPGAERTDQRDGADRDENAAAGAARGPEIKPPAQDGAIAAAPSGAPRAVAEVIGEKPDGASEGPPKADLQNGREMDPARAPADRPGACRSYHKQVAKEAVGAVVRGGQGSAP
jgi:hypothetical protein